ncbi:DNA double-strand break repair nuclease NurA [Pyrobaculum sp.]|uniref:DNA double-strand break repair nuclease NurA n=1 Tax=Pyrobaculum sp. TaxID=2004705 RepID=UPI00316772D2
MFITHAERKLKAYLHSRSQHDYPITSLEDSVQYKKVEPYTGDSLLVAGVDGGIAMLKLANGHQVVLARAAAVGPGFVEREFEADIAKVESASMPWAYLVIVESLVGIKAIERHSVDVLLMDGSLYAKTVRLVHNLILAREFQNLYYIPELAAALHLLAKLIDTAQRRGTKLIFVSKDHSFKLLKEHVIFEKLSARQRDPIYQRGLQWYSVLWIRRFRKELLEIYKQLRGHDYESSRLLAMLITPSITDSELLGQLLPPGSYTVPMLVGGCDAYMNYKGLTTVDKLVKAAEDRLEDSLIFRLKEQYSQDVVGMIREALEVIPKIYFLYVKFGGDDTPLLVEIPAEGTKMFDGAAVKAFYPPARVGDIVGLLATQYRDPIHYNAWLWYAHAVASFRASHLSEYAVYLKSMAGGVGMGRRLKLAWGV